MITIKIAGIPIGIDNRYEYVRNLAAEYLTDDEPSFTVSATDGELDEERARSEMEFGNGYLESIVAYRKIAEMLPRYDAFVFHGAVLNHGGLAYAFTARSGVGKTTHTRLWINEFGDNTHYLNGDKPVIRIIDGQPYASGTPWRGKEKYGVNEVASLQGIALLERGERNAAAPIDATIGMLRLMSQIYLPADKEALRLTMKLADRVIRSVRLIELKCNMDPEAAHVARAALID